MVDMHNIPTITRKTSKSFNRDQADPDLPFSDNANHIYPDFENLLHVPWILSFHGYIYIQVCRGSSSCVYRQTYGKETQGFEVFIIRKQKEVILNGKVYPARERWPKDDDFGKTAWTYRTLERAMTKYNELEQ
jgi:hypothetical protein